MQPERFGIIPRLLVSLIIFGLAFQAAPGYAAPADTIVYLPVIMQANPSPKDLVFQAESDSSDAELGNLNCTAWAACRSALYGNFWLNGSADATIESSYNAGKYTLKRVVLFFDTSALPDQAVVTSARLRFYSGPLQAGSNKVHVVRTTASTPPGPSSFGTVILSSGGSAAAGVSQWVEIPLNPAALSWIHKAGFTRLALVHDLDLTGAAPAGLNYLGISLWEKAWLEPELLVTYVIVNR